VVENRGLATVDRVDASLGFAGARSDAEARTSDFVLPAQLGGQNLIPGVYTIDAAVGLTGTLTLNDEGDADAAWIFRMTGALTTAANSNMVFASGNNNPANVFWKVDGAITTGADSTSVGYMYAVGAVTVGAGATSGPVLAEGAVTFGAGGVIAADSTYVPTQVVVPAAPAPSGGSLTDRWSVGDPTFGYNALVFSLVYALNAAYDSGTSQVDASLYTFACQEDGFALTAGALAFDTGTGADVAITESTAAVRIVLDPELIVSDSMIYSESVEGGQLFAAVNFCVRVGLSIRGGSSFEVNFLETLVTLNVDLTDGFEIGTVAVAPKDVLLKTANQAYEVEGYICGGTSSEANGQGSVIEICVRPKEAARNDGITMREIQSFEFTRLGDDAAGQKAIVAGQPSLNQLTTMDCLPGFEVCSFKTILFANFYKSSGTVAGNGIASMQFGGSARRLRSQNGRSLQDLEQDEAAGAAEFELDFGVAEASDDVATSGAAGSGVFAMSLFAAAGALALL
jgi:hypothetical protein